jgi:hypothetical protein
LAHVVVGTGVCAPTGVCASAAIVTGIEVIVIPPTTRIVIVATLFVSRATFADGVSCPGVSARARRGGFANEEGESEDGRGKALHHDDE